MNHRRWRYVDAGVNVDKIKKGQRNIAELLRQTFVNREKKIGSVLEEIGHYAGLIDIGKSSALALHTDGVGTKILIAQMMDRFDTIGIDCVAMNVNDVICVGAEPLAFLDYIALKRFDEELVKEIVKGLVTGAKEASVAIVGGETAVMPDVIEGEGDKAFDLVGMVLGLVNKQNIMIGSKIREGDVIVGAGSSGIHSNGLSLARKVLFQKYKVDEYVKGLDMSLGEDLLKPTRIYVKAVLEVLRSKVEVSGLAHITGGGFSKLTRLVKGRNLKFRIDSMPKQPAIFELIQKEGKISKREMYRTFNMGIGFCLITPSYEVEDVVSIFQKYDIESHIIGKMVKGLGVYVDKVRVD